MLGWFTCSSSTALNVGPLIQATEIETTLYILDVQVLLLDLLIVDIIGHRDIRELKLPENGKYLLFEMVPQHFLLLAFEPLDFVPIGIVIPLKVLLTLFLDAIIVEFLFIVQINLVLEFEIKDFLVYAYQLLELLLAHLVYLLEGPSYNSKTILARQSILFGQNPGHVLGFRHQQLVLLVIVAEIEGCIDKLNED